MCPAVTGLSVAATWMLGATAVISAATAVYAKKQQDKATEQMAQVQQDQIDDQAQQRTQERMEQARALRAQARASAAEAGIAGNSVGVMLNDIMGQAGRDVSLIETNRKNGIAASAAEADARMRSSKAEMYGQLASTATNTYMNYTRYQVPAGG